MQKDAIKQITKKYDGFISAYIHISMDGIKVLSYIQWENKDAIEKMLNDTKVIIHICMTLINLPK
ncbi:Tetracenomycin-F1 monooxygenase (fragment) [Candidatus Nitrosocosmicus franklandus]|uniref:Tetracenomycin-F1 monooxygenase n=1 Tax=Candidatus Nitrosocosmicus franklandianus TaxID=1798806 RepID=A0A484IAT8_9ARCH